MSSPSDIEVMIHYYVSSEPHPRIDAPAVSNAVSRFMDAGLLQPTDAYPSGFEVSQGGELFIRTLCGVPWPIRRWVVPEKEPEQ